MFGTIRKHQGWLWWLVIVVIVVSFVIFFSPSSNVSSFSGSANFGSIDGEKISEENLNHALREASLQFYFRYGSWPDTDAKRLGYDPERAAYERLFFLQKIKQHKIKADTASVAQTANTILASMGRGNPIPLSAFEEQLLKQHGLTAEDFRRYVQHELEMQQLISVVSVAGKLVTPAEAQALYVRERQEFSASAAFFNASNYLSTVSAPTPETVAQFYTNRMSAYRIPEQIQVSYVKFDITNFLADADQQIAKLTNFSAMVEQVYLQRGTNYYKESLTPDQTKARIREDMRRERATVTARKRANDFASELDDRQPKRPENLAAFAQSNGLTIAVSAPFQEETGPTEFDGGPNFARAAFRLTLDEPFAGPLLGSDAVYVITLNKRIPSEVPPLEQIRSQVEADYKLNEAARLASTKGMQFADALTNGLAQGKTFAGICTDAKVKPALLPPFSLSTRELPELEDQIALNQFKQIVFETRVGASSGFLPTAKGGVVVYVQQRLPIDEGKMRAELPEFMKGLRQARQNEALQFWYRREIEKSMRDTPFLQQQQPPGRARS